MSLLNDDVSGAIPVADAPPVAMAGLPQVVPAARLRSEFALEMETVVELGRLPILRVGEVDEDEAASLRVGRGDEEELAPRLEVGTGLLERDLVLSLVRGEGPTAPSRDDSDEAGIVGVGEGEYGPPRAIDRHTVDSLAEFEGLPDLVPRNWTSGPRHQGL